MTQASVPRRFNSAAQNEPVLRRLVDSAAGEGAVIMQRLVNSASSELNNRVKSSKDLRVRDAALDSARKLSDGTADLVAHYPAALLKVFSRSSGFTKATVPADLELQFDTLELMDEAQVIERVVMARAQQSALLAADAALVELTALICAAQGLATVQPERNPLRPENYVAALKAAVGQLNVSPAIQLDWLQLMSASLGPVLREAYAAMIGQLRGQGLAPARYAILQTPGGQGTGARVLPRSNVPGLDGSSGESGASSDDPLQGASTPEVPRRTGVTPKVGSGEFTRASSARATHSTLLTLDRLRRLLIGDLGTATALPPAEPTLKTPKLHADTERFAQELDVPSLPAELAVSSDFHPTVPAALDALREMKQVDQIIQRMQNRQTYDARRDAGRAAGAAPAGAQRFALAHASSGTLVQALGVEVVALMIDNIAADDRLVPSVQRLVRSMEPALMQLAVLDPRFFSEKEHPARRLLHEFVQRGLAFESEATTGLAKFIEVTKPPLAKLSRAAIDGAEPFERALSELQKAWAKVIDTVLEPSAMLALQNAEQRHILAEEISEKIAVHPDMAFVPEAVAGFLCGPWSQVIAQACLSGLALESKAQRYQNLVPALLWTANPQSATLNLSRLARTIPPLLATLREGLETIQYPTLKTSEFFDTLMKLHEIAFKNKQVNQASLSPVPFAPAGALLTGPEISSTAPLQAEVWVAPSEAGASNFLAFPENAPDVFLPHTTNTNTNANNNHGQNSLAALDQGDISRHAASAEGTTPVRVINAPQVAADVDTTTLVEHPPTTGEPQEPVDGVLSLGELQLGTWVEILTGGRWVRSRLAWVSSHATMYMFTSAGGQSHSMTRRSWLRMMQTGQARSLAEKGLLDRALDGVAQTALRNSINSESS